jgi:hypothetical protein
MSTQDDESKPPSPMEPFKQAASACGPGCACQPSGRSLRIRWIIGLIVLLAAAVLIARALVKSRQASAPAAPACFALAPSADAGPSTAKPGGLEAKEIAAISELNTLAMDTDAVFVFLPTKEASPHQMPTALIQAAVQTIEEKAKIKMGLFTLKAEGSDYQQLATQTPVPAVLTIVKGRGMRAVSGEMTEAKLVQAFVAASSAGSCGPTAGSGCCPK